MKVLDGGVPVLDGGTPVYERDTEFSFDFTSMPDGGLPDGLVQYDLPGQSEAGIQNGRLRPLGASTEIHLVGISALYKRATVFVEMPTENNRVDVTYDTDTAGKAVHQVGPCVGTGPWQRPTYSFLSDYAFLSILGHYLNAAAAPPIAEMGDIITGDPWLPEGSTKYNQHILGEGLYPPAPLTGNSVDTIVAANPVTMVLRTLGGQCDCWWEGTKILGPMDYRYAPVTRFNRVGIELIHIKTTDVRPPFEFAEILTTIPEDEICVRSLNITPCTSLAGGL